MHSSRVSIRKGLFNTTMLWGGAGPPVLYLHGAAGPLPEVPFLTELTNHFSVFAPAHPGFPPADGLEHLDHIIDLALYYLDFCTELGIERPHLIGHSMGGMLACEMAALSPPSVGKLVLACPAGLWLDNDPIPDFFAFKPQQLLDYALFDPTGPLAQMMLQSFTDPVTGLTMHQHLAAAGKFLWPIPDKGLKKRIHRIKAPTMLIWGAADRIVPPIYGPAFLNGITGSRLVVLEKSGHLPMLEEGDAFAWLSHDFLAGD